MKRLLRFVAGLVDPSGPIGEWLSPAPVYKSRLGLPISNAHSVRAAMQAPSDIDRVVGATRFVSAQEAGSVPRNRVRQVSAFVEEVYAPVYARTDSTDLAEILRSSQQLVGWNVTTQQTSASRARRSVEEVVEIMQTVQIQASDEFYNGLLQTVPGDDPVIIDGKVLRGTPTYDAQGRMTHDGIVRGTMITKGRTEYNKRTEGFVHWDKGFAKERERAIAEEASRPIRNVKRNLERLAGEVLPMRRVLSNPRYDRRAAC